MSLPLLKTLRQGSHPMQMRKAKTHVLTVAGQHPASAAIPLASLTSPPLLPSLPFPQCWPPHCSLESQGFLPSSGRFLAGWLTLTPPPLLQASHSSITPSITGHCTQTHITMRSIESWWEFVV